MEENGDLMKHMNEFDGIIDQLKKVDVKVEEKEKALLFLALLSDSYEKSKEGDRDLSGLALVTKVRRKKSTDMGSKGGLEGMGQCTRDGSYPSEISFVGEVIKGSNGVDDGERMKNLANNESKGSLRCWKVGGVRKLQFGATGGRGLRSLNSSLRWRFVEF
ncbi:hypothetical protein QQP08_004914 [Theobroma cacao]|nr:hypothetical protein QQP08_004914 [Theobroma cacao]